MPPPKTPMETWRGRVLLVWLPLFILFIEVAVLAALLALADNANAADKMKVKEGATLTLSCPGDGIEQGGTATWFDKRNANLGSTAGVVRGGTVAFGPAPKKVEYVLVELDCAAPATTTSSTSATTSSTTTSTSTTTTTTLPDPNVYLTGTVTVTDQGYIIYAPASDNIPGSVSCPAGTRLDFAASTFSNSTEVSVQYFPSFNWIIATSIDDPTPTDPNVERELTFRIVCVPA